MHSESQLKSLLQDFPELKRSTNVEKEIAAIIEEQLSHNPGPNRSLLVLQSNLCQCLGEQLEGIISRHQNCPSFIRADHFSRDCLLPHLATDTIKQDSVMSDPLAFLQTSLRESLSQISNNSDIMCCDSGIPQNPHNGMELRGNRVRAADEQEENQNDSGFGSGSIVQPIKHHHDSNYELKLLMRNCQEMENCCFYHRNLDSNSARSYLRKKPTGTFLIRDSSDPRYLFCLSVKTDRGATSVRILYNNCLFQFDSDESIRKKLPSFESVLALVDFHFMASQRENNKTWRWEENSGRKNMKVQLTQPLMSSTPSLAHLARVKINQCLENVHLPHLSVGKLPLGQNLQEYLKDYPYRV